LPGIMAEIVDETGHSVGKGKGGMLVITRPWPAMIRTIYGDAERFKKQYYPEEFQGKYYLAGDGANRDLDGYFWIMGRIDDVLNVSGHRLGTMEIESALVAHPKVAEAAVVGRQHEIKGESVFAYVVLRGDRPTGPKAEKFTQVLRDWVTEQLSAIARPDDIRFADNLPKTRSGKIMRRLLRAIARNEDIAQDQDLSTLENPAIIEQLRGDEKAAAAPTPSRRMAAAKPPPKKPAPKKRAPKKKAAAKRAVKRPTKKFTKKVAKKPANRPSKKAANKKPAARRKK
jgi:acetyl-CoA synthetase